MEQPGMNQEQVHTETVPFRLLHGVCETVLNVGRRISDSLDPAYYAKSHVKPGLLDVIREIREERRHDN
jgi:hypothetical protein